MRVNAYIDSNNLHLGIKSLGWSIDYRKFRIYLKDKYQVEKAYMFIGYIPQNSKLYSNLSKAGFELVFKPAVQFKQSGNKTIKGNADAELVLHCIKHIYTNQCDQAVIVTGDGDFFCLVQDLSNQNKLKRLLIPNKLVYSQLFAPYIKEIDFVEKQKKKIMLSNKIAGAGLGTNPQTRLRHIDK